MKAIAFPAALLLLVSLAPAAVTFTAQPTAAVRDGGVEIRFAVSAPTDVEVAVVDAKGNVRRHLAAGAVGAERAAPPLKARALAQSLLWDRKDDSGKPVAGKVSVRVRAGLSFTRAKIIGEPSRLTGKVFGLATDAEGALYVASGGVYSGSPVFTIKVFDRKGEYLRTILPFPATLSAEQAAEYGGASEVGGLLAPDNFDPRVPYLQRGGIVAFVGNQLRGGVLWLLSTEGRLCRIRSDGSPVAWRSAPRTKTPSGGPMCWAVSPDAKSLYMAGYWNIRGAAKGALAAGDGVVCKVDPATGAAEPFVKIDAPDDSVWLKEVNGWYHFTNWGRKNGLAALHGMAVDAQGRLLVCDRVNQRLAVYDAAGKLLGSTAIEWPDIVSLSPTDDSVYVCTRKIVDGYKAVNEFRIVKLSAALDGKVLAELTLGGENAPSMAVDATAKPAVLWLSNVGKGGGQLVRIEDRGKEFVVTGELNDKLPAARAIVKIWPDPVTDEIYVNDGWSGLSRYNGLTGEGSPIPITAIDLAVGPDRNLYLFGRKGWEEPIYRCDLRFKPVPFSGTGKPETTKTSADRSVYGRYGTGWSNKGLDVTADGRIFVDHMYDWNKYYVSVFAADGTAEKHDRVAGGIVGPLDPPAGGLKVDREGNIYIGMAGHPKGFPKAREMESCVVKFAPTGGGRAPKGSDAKGLAWPDGTVVEGGLLAYPHMAPQAYAGCVCKEARFDLDGYGRLFVPSVLDFCVRVYDNAGNLIARTGRYGNADSPERATAPPADVPMGWPMTCGVTNAGRLYVGDVVNQRIVRADPAWAAEAACPVP